MCGVLGALYLNTQKCPVTDPGTWMRLEGQLFLSVNTYPMQHSAESSLYWYGMVLALVWWRLAHRKIGDILLNLAVVVL